MTTTYRKLKSLVEKFFNRDITARKLAKEVAKLMDNQKSLEFEKEANRRKNI